MATPFSITSPVDGSLIPAGSYLSYSEASEKLSRAENAQRIWRNVPVTQRVGVVRQFLDCFDAEAEENARQVSLAMGKPIRQAKNEIAGMRARAEALCWQAPLVLADQTLPAKENL